MSGSASFSGPAPSEIEKSWTLWHPRMLMLFSCFLQVAQMLLGMWRKQSYSGWIIKLLTWLSYNVANGISYFAIVFPFVVESNTDRRLVALWASFSLLHSGGVDTLNAYSLEDNRLWKRHVLYFIAKLGMCVTVVSQCSLQLHGWFVVVVVPVFIIAVCNYAERIWVHKRGTMDGLRESLQDLEAQPDYSAIMDKKLRIERSGRLSTELRIPKPRPPWPIPSASRSFFPPSIAGGVEALITSNLMHKRYRGLYDNERYCREDREYNRRWSAFASMSYDEAFQVVENQMSLMHDEIYTRAPALHTRWGLISRLCFFIAMLGCAITFAFLVNKRGLPVPSADVLVTYLLFIFDAFVRGLSLFVFVFSHQNTVGIINSINNNSNKWMVKVKVWVVQLTFKVWHIKSPWLSMGQFDFRGCCLDHQSSHFKRCMQSIGVSGEVENYFHTKYIPISNEVKDSIFQVLRDKSNQAQDAGDYKRFTASRGQWALTVGNCVDKLGWSVKDRGLSQSLCIWITAINLYHASQGSEASALLKTAKHLSDYLLHLLRVNPVLLPSVAPDSVKICNKTIAELRIFIHDIGPLDTKDWVEASLLILGQSTYVDPRRVRGDQIMSVLWDGCILAQKIQELETENKELILVRVLVELLTDIALQCRGELHAQLLAEGLGLVTIVWWIAFHLGLSPCYEFESAAAAITVVSAQR
uniref:DUF4220 domain-containing protein n=1 Tax=Davidia involucrata TaxID=16924 RepID=A0A5B7BJK7_DAVIN